MLFGTCVSMRRRAKLCKLISAFDNREERVSMVSVTFCVPSKCPLSNLKSVIGQDAVKRITTYKSTNDDALSEKETFAFGELALKDIIACEVTAFPASVFASSNCFWQATRRT